MWTEVQLDKPRGFEAGQVLHLRVVSCFQRSTTPARWTLKVEDVTPLPGAEPPGYACYMCGIVEEAKPDGSLPDGWTVKEFGDGINHAKGFHFVCREEFCQKEPMCRLCGCTNDKACNPPCRWVEPDRCSGCE
jgi:hypothetical protein